MPQLQSALAQMLARVGKQPADFKKNTRMGKVFKRRGVASSSELTRILRLPRRKWSEDESIDALASDLTSWLKIPEGTMTLRPVQAKALEELHDFGGLLAPIRVGGGKTLISMLAPIVLGAERPCLLVSAKLREKTKVEFAELRKHWLFHPRLEILSYEILSRDGGYELLERINPDLIVADEAHRLKNTNSGCTRKARRWSTEHPETRWALMSGTITTRSLRDYGHLAKWSLHDLCPLPDHANELADWADALDTKVEPNRMLLPGALLGLCNDDELAEVAADGECQNLVARKAFRRRLVETPGVIATEERALGASLCISHKMIDISKECAVDFKRLREDWETPDGHPFTEAVDLWRHARSLSCGLFMIWDPPPPKEWMDARREWARMVRKVLASRRKGIDTEFQVAKACVVMLDAGEKRSGVIDAEVYETWAGIRDTFKPNSVPVWRHQIMLNAAAKWLAEAPGIVWAEHVAFGKELSKLTGLPYFGEGGVDKNGTAIEITPWDRVIASIASNSEGRNLQRWNRCLVVSPPPNGGIWEQMLGRCHREGQEADEVEYQVMLACREQWAGMNQAIEDAKYVDQTTGQPQKLLYADKSLPSGDQVAALIGSRNPMWEE